MTRVSIVWRWTLVLLLAGLSLFVSQGLKVGDEARDLLPGEAVRGDLDRLQRIGMVDRIFIDLEMLPAAADCSQAESFKALSASADRVGAALSVDPLFSEVVYRLPAGYEWRLFATLRASLPALLTSEDLEKISTRLTPEGLRAALTEDFALLNSLAGLPLKEQVRQDPLGLSRLVLQRLNSLGGEFAMQVRDGFFFSRQGAHCFLWAQSALSLTDSATAEKVQAGIEQVLKANLDPRVRARIVGTLPHTLANSRTIRADLHLLLPAASVALLVLLLITIREPQAFLVLAIPMLAAPLAVAIHGLACGQISRMALGFGIVLLGISTDYTVYYYLALSRESGPDAEIRKRIRVPIGLALATTIGVFVVLLFSAVPSHRQMAFLALVGVCIAVLLTWFLVPTMITARQRQAREQQGDPAGPAATLAATAGPRKMWALAAWFLLLLAGSLAWPRLHYCGDLRALDATSAQVAADEAQFRAVWRHQEEQAFAVVAAGTLAGALDANDAVYERLRKTGISSVQSIAPLLPGPAAQAQRFAAWRDFWASRGPALTRDLDRIGAEIGFAAGAFSPFFSWLATPPQPLAAEEMLAGPLRPVLIALLRQPDARDKITPDAKQQVLVTTMIPDTPGARTALSDLAGSGLSLSILANTKWREQVEGMLRSDILRLSLAAGLINLVIVWLFFRRLRPVLACLAPMAAALSAMAAFSATTTGEINIMHALMGVMIIGISTDYGILVVCACQDRASRTIFLAVSICALSTLIGFGVLALAAHPALFTLGATALVGIGAAWPSALWVSPTLLKKI